MFRIGDPVKTGFYPQLSQIRLIREVYVGAKLINHTGTVTVTRNGGIGQRRNIILKGGSIGRTDVEPGPVTADRGAEVIVKFLTKHARSDRSRGNRGPTQVIVARTGNILATVKTGPEHIPVRIFP